MSRILNKAPPTDSEFESDFAVEPPRTEIVSKTKKISFFIQFEKKYLKIEQ